MSVEVQCFRLRKRGDDVLEQSHSINCGGFKPITYLTKLKILAFCDHYDTNGKIILSGKNIDNRIAMKIYENDLDEIGKWLPSNSETPIFLTGRQSISIRNTRGKVNREVFIYLCSDSDSGGQGDYNGSPINSPKDGRSLVLV